MRGESHLLILQVLCHRQLAAVLVLMCLYSSHSNVNSHQQLQQSAATEVIAETRNDSDDSTSISVCDSQAQIMPRDTAIIQS